MPTISRAVGGRACRLTRSLAQRRAMPGDYLGVQRTRPACASAVSGWLGASGFRGGLGVGQAFHNAPADEPADSIQLGEKPFVVPPDSSRLARFGEPTRRIISTAICSALQIPIPRLCGHAQRVQRVDLHSRCLQRFGK